MAIEHIKLSKQAKDQLVKLKRNTGIQNWNVLCRWGFCLSIAEASVPTQTRIPADSSLEMTWKTFAGTHQELYFALLKERCIRDGFELSPESLAEQFKLHLHRGIGYLVADISLKSIAQLLKRVES